MPFQVVVIILHRLEWRCALSAGEGRIESVKAKKVIERTDNGQVHDFLGQTLQRVHLVLLEHVISNLVGRVQSVAVDRLQALQIGLGGAAFICEIAISDEIAKTVGIAHIAAKHGV